LKIVFCRCFLIIGCFLSSQYIFRPLNKPLRIKNFCVGNTYKGWFETCVEKVSSVELLTSHKIATDYESCVGSLKGKHVEFSATFYTGEKKLQYFRLIRFIGEGFNVFNLVAIPNVSYDLPIFGADVVILPGGTLASIDLQPSRNCKSYFESDIYKSFAPISAKWRSLLVDGGPLPKSAAAYFSPYAIWTRISREDFSSLEVIEKAMYDAIDCYCTAVQQAAELENAKSSDTQTKYDLENFINSYLVYRAENDPAKKLLVAAFGKEWTDVALTTAIFPNKII